MSQSDMLVFLQNLDRSRLLGSQAATEIWEKAGAETPSVADTQGFAAWLVQQGKLTQYQADKILRGSTRFFLDDYKLMDTIGTGRMAGVYRAIHKLGMPVAVKILPPSSAKKPEVLARFQREAELALKLDHKHVVKTYHAGFSDGLHYIAMEFLEGETLEERLKEKGQLRGRSIANRRPDPSSPRSSAREGHGPSRCEAGQHHAGNVARQRHHRTCLRGQATGRWTGSSPVQRRR